MKRLTLLLCTISLLSFVSCDNEDAIDCIEVKFVTEVCGNAILQVVDNRAGLALSTWTNYNDEVFENVFGTFLDPCMENYPNDLDDTFFISLVDVKEQSNCIVCLALPASMPEQFYNVSIVESCDTDLLND